MPPYTSEMTESPQLTAEEFMRQEVLARNSTAAVGFFVGALLCFQTELFFPSLTSLEEALCVLLMVVNALRFVVSYRWRRDRTRLNSLWWPLCSLIWVNSVVWGILFGLANWLTWYPSYGFALSMLIITAYAMASTFTLSLYAYLINPFVVALIGPQVAIGLWRHFAFSEPLGIPVTIYAVLLMFFVISVARDYRQRFKEKVTADIQLQKSQVDLIETQKKLLMQQAAIEQSNRLASVGEMAAGFAHEVNNPLAIISVSLSLLKTFAGESPEANAHIERCNRAVDRITKIVKGLRNLSRPDLSESKTAQNVQGLVEEVLSFCQAKLSSAGIHLRTQLQADLLVPCRPVQISQILLNLINNACDAMEELPPHVTRSIELRTYAKDRMVYITVSNAGPALTADVREKIFMPFFTTKEVGKGTGLGLPLSRSMAQSHGGDLYLDASASTPTFVLRLPA